MKREFMYLGLGAGLMYFFDPSRGRARRARVRDWITHQLDEVDAGLEVAAHDLENRTHGLMARTRALFDRDGEHAPDPVIVARVRSRLGRIVSHPRAVLVVARHGRVELSGSVLASEAGHLLADVASIRGVVGVENRLHVFEQASDHPALRAETACTRRQARRRKMTWPPATYLLATAAIAAGTLRAVVRGRRPTLALGALGFAFALRDLGLHHGRSRRRRNFARARPVLATGAPLHDVKIPFRGPQLEAPDIGL